jgi:SAM-dependent methyltransferase
VVFVRCVECGVVYKQFEAASLQSKSQSEASYFHGRKSGHDRRFDHRVDKAVRWLRSVLEFGPATSVLDVGCSLGYGIEAGRRLGLRSTGTDVSRYAVGVCQRRGLDAAVGTLEAQPFDDAAFDVVVMRRAASRF